MKISINQPNQNKPTKQNKTAQQTDKTTENGTKFVDISMK
tara:strand:+ start:279 stop:398 length:120 start_codon:yes stop_codon:yes gene_type:complete